MQVRIDISGGELEALLRRAAAMPSKALPALVAAIFSTSQDIVGAAVKKRFLGKGPFPVSQNKLGAKSRRLATSIRCTKPQLNLRTGQISVGFGSNVAYFAIHEFGFEGSVKVKGHQRRLNGAMKTNSRGKLTKDYQNRLKKKLISRNLAGVKPGNASGTQVRGHRRQMKVPARAPLGTELKAPTTSAAYLKKITAALTAALRK